MPTAAIVGERMSNSERECSEQAAILLRIQLGHEQWRVGSGWRSSVTFLVARPAIERFRPGRTLSAAVRKDLNTNLSAVHENIRSRAFRN